MSKKFLVSATLLALLVFLIPIEHKYDKLFRFFSLTLIPEGLKVSPLYEKKLYFYISDLIALSLMFIGLFWVKISPKRFFFNPLWVVFLLAFVSIALSPFHSYLVAYSRLLQLSTGFILFSFISSAFNEEEKNKLTTLILYAILFAGLFQIVVGFFQYFNQAPLGLRLLGETTEKSILVVENGKRWLFDEFSEQIRDPVLRRPSGTLPHANVFGGFILFSIFATYALFLRSGKKWLLFLLPFQIFAISLSFSRSALFGWLLASASFFFLVWIKKGLEKRFIILSVIVFFSFLSSFTLLFNQYTQRGGVVGSTALSSHSDQIRKIHQFAALEIIKEVPLKGLGFSQFSEHSKKFLSHINDPYIQSTAPHNIFLFLACETGLISLGAFFLFFILLLKKMFQSPMNVEKILFFSLLVAFLFIGLCDFYPILFQQGKNMLFLIAGLLSLHTKVCNPIDGYGKKEAYYLR